MPHARDPELQRFYRLEISAEGPGEGECGGGSQTRDPAVDVCCGTTLSTTNSVVVDRSSRKAVMPVRGCQKRGMVRKVTGRLIRLTHLPLAMGSSNNSSWSMVIEEMFGGTTLR